MQDLQTLGFLDVMKAHASMFEPLMCWRESTLTAAVVESIFQPQLSAPGSNRRTVENLVYAWWLDMLQT